MNPSETAKQIHQMVGFILKEAEERAREIKKETESEANARLLERERTFKSQLKDEFERKKKEKIIDQRKKRSSLKNNARIVAMQQRERVVNLVKVDVLGSLADVSENQKYPDLIRYLIAQGLMIITEAKVTVQCRQEDEKIVQAELPAAYKLYLDFIREQTGITPKVVVQLSKDWLPPGPKPGETGLSCCGGVVLSARNGTIVCKNTLDSRLDLCFDKLKPQIRGLLFGVRPKIPNAESEIDRLAAKHHAELVTANAKWAASKQGQGAAAAAAASTAAPAKH